MTATLDRTRFKIDGRPHGWRLRPASDGGLIANDR